MSIIEAGPVEIVTTFIEILTMECLVYLFSSLYSMYVFTYLVL